MARRRRRRKRDHGCDDIPVASFSDIAFLLIIFFILATTLATTRGFITELPSGEKSEKPPEKTTTVHLNAGVLRIDDDVVSLKELKAKLLGMKLHAQSGDGKVVMFEATGRVDYQDYYEIMAVVARAGGSICIVREEGGDE
ncbi:biopolymer transporter ExbD [bacterium]|nr:biopolymer transporter ExbD [bacterium]